LANNLKDIYVGVKKNSENRVKNDFYPTPPIATYILHKYSNLPKVIVEPCAGRGNISIELLRHGYDVRSYDLNDYENSLCHIVRGQDVMDLQKPYDAEALVTNPPYHKDLPRLIAEKGVSEYDFTALFVRLTFLEGKKRKKLFTNHPPSNIIFLSDRIRFDRPDYTGLLEPINKSNQLGGMIAYCWVIWNKKAEHRNTKLRWVTLEDEYDEWRSHYEQHKHSNSSSR
jgi:hypothetical protein